MREILFRVRKILGSSSRGIFDRITAFAYGRVMGYDLHKHHLLVAGCCCNVERYLPAILKNIEKATELFASYKVVIVESDSTDGTGQGLEQWASKEPERRIILRLGCLKEEMPLRTQRIAYCRNQYLRYFEENGLYSKHDLLLILDMDDVCARPINLEGLLSCFVPRRMTDWDALAANREREYCDIWALRSAGWCEYDCWEKIKKRPADMSYDEAVRQYVSEKQIHIPEDAEWIECASAFGGMVLYKTRLLHGCRYVGVDASQQDEVCEHVEFHRQFIERGGNLFINPRFLNG